MPVAIYCKNDLLGFTGLCFVEAGLCNHIMLFSGMFSLPSSQKINHTGAALNGNNYCLTYVSKNFKCWLLNSHLLTWSFTGRNQDKGLDQLDLLQQNQAEM